MLLHVHEQYMTSRHTHANSTIFAVKHSIGHELEKQLLRTCRRDGALVARLQHREQATQVECRQTTHAVIVLETKLLSLDDVSQKWDNVHKLLA